MAQCHLCYGWTFVAAVGRRLHGCAPCVTSCYHSRDMGKNVFVWHIHIYEGPKKGTQVTNMGNSPKPDCKRAFDGWVTQPSFCPLLLECLAHFANSLLPLVTRLFSTKRLKKKKKSCAKTTSSRQRRQQSYACENPACNHVKYIILP